jgi:hypothetical protein
MEPFDMNEYAAALAAAQAEVDREHPGLPFITRIVMAGDRASMARWEADARAGRIEPEKAISLTGSYSRMTLALRLLDDGLIDPEVVYRNLPSWWSSADPDDTDPRLHALWRDARARKGGLLTDEGRRLPGDPIRVYRGQMPGDPVGCAWSLSREVAERFQTGASFRTHVQGGVLYVLTVPASDAIAYITGRGEEEIILDPAGLVPKAA